MHAGKVCKIHFANFYSGDFYSMMQNAPLSKFRAQNYKIFVTWEAEK